MTIIEERAVRPAAPCEQCGGKLVCTDQVKSICAAREKWREWTPRDAYRAHLKWMERQMRFKT